MSTHSAGATLRGFSGHLLLVGAGKMGHALLEGWLGLGLDPHRILVFEPQPAPDLEALAPKGLRLNPPPSEAQGAAAIVIAVKPQIATEAVPPLAPLVGSLGVAISIMAGKPLRTLEQALPGAAIVRAMPNTPAAIGRGITVAVANQRVSSAQRDLAHALLSATGAMEWISEEALMDAVTAVSGSGPAYVFLLVEALAQAGIDAGLPPDLAAKLARETVTGAGELLHRSALDPATLRKNVTSQGGTTEAALAVLMSADGLAPLMTKAVAAATRRSRALAR
ncbi:MAG: pyrroline-5-carboxylate reductase [Xanthobacteraceae bacterium]